MYRQSFTTILVSLLLGLWSGVAIVAAVSPALATEGRLQLLSQSLYIEQMFEIIHEEGIAHGKEIDAQLLGGNGGPSWQQTVSRIYEPKHLVQNFQQSFEKEVGLTGADPEPMVDFYQSELGQKVAQLELSARRAFLDDSIRRTADEKLDRALLEQDPRLQKIKDFVDENQLVEMNVVTALNGNLAFLRAMAASAGVAGRMTEAEMLSEVGRQEADIRQGTERWILNFSLMAYAPLSDQELKDYLVFSKSAAGSALNRALFAAFDSTFTDVSDALGRSVGAWMQGTDL